MDYTQNVRIEKKKEIFEKTILCVSFYEVVVYWHDIIFFTFFECTYVNLCRNPVL